ncbi:MAG: tetratricopeptide repeat protein [Desulfobacterales bacterium]|nr:MAG: tetratricopeptide repeat protein [Desulfobacterales bacterium]UCD90302.1 MAG: tetratricopeptide repeat protein [Desulfobacterales bacterium]
MKWRHLIATLRILFFALSFIVLPFSPSLAGSNPKPDHQSSLIIDADKQFDFAQHHFTTQAYAMAIIEYQRFIYFFSEDKRVPLALYRIGMSYYLMNRFQEAVESFEKVIHQYADTDLSVKSYFMVSKSLLGLKDSGSAIINLHNLIALTDDVNVKDEANYRIGWIHLEMDSWEKATVFFAKISPHNKPKYRLERLSAELEKVKLLPKKDPEIAGLLSIIPGGGYLYCERYQDALIAFLLNGALIYAAYESFDEEHYALGGLISLVGLGFYAGNVYGAITSAHKYNRSKKGQFLRKLKESSKVNFWVDIENQGAGLALLWNF